MRNSRTVVVMLSIGGLLAGGCQSNSTATIAEYRPRHALTEHTAPDSEVFQLVRWTPVAPAMTPSQASKAATRPARQMPVELEQVYVPRGRSIGFRRAEGQLIAVADSDTTPLPEAHYEWKTLPGHPGSRSQEGHPRLDHIVDTALVVAAVVGVVVMALWVIHADRHSLLDDLFNDGN